MLLRMAFRFVLLVLLYKLSLCIRYHIAIQFKNKQFTQLSTTELNSELLQYSCYTL